jgi:low affinity Fe/Cu permease
MGFVFAVSTVIAWLVTGLFLHFGILWQSIINLIVAAITFMLLFIIQHKHNRDFNAIIIKLDELILASKKARNKVIDAENLPDDELEEHKKHLLHQKN